MKLQLLVLGCCVALAIGKPAENVCREMKARAFAALGGLGRVDVNPLSTCDRNGDGSVDGEEFAHCLHRAVGDHSGLRSEDLEERINCLKNMMEMSAEEQREMMDVESARQEEGFITANMPTPKSALSCDDKNALSRVLAMIVAGEILTATSELVNVILSFIVRPGGGLDGTLESLGSVLQALLTGNSFVALLRLSSYLSSASSRPLDEALSRALTSALIDISLRDSVEASNKFNTAIDSIIVETEVASDVAMIREDLSEGATGQATVNIVSLLSGIANRFGVDVWSELAVAFELAVKGSITEARAAFDTALWSLQLSPWCYSTFLEGQLKFILDAFVSGDSSALVLNLSFLFSVPCDYIGARIAITLGTILNALARSDAATAQTHVTAIIQASAEGTVSTSVSVPVQQAKNLIDLGNITGAIAKIITILVECAAAQT